MPAPLTEPRRATPGRADLAPWSAQALRMRLPALLAALAAGEIDQAAEVCREQDDPDQLNGLTGPVMTDPTDRRH